MTAYHDIRDALLATPRLRPTGARTKPALSHTPPDTTALDLTACRGIVEYHPEEFTFTARAGTPLAEIEHALASHRQYLPFDPPLVAQGATLGGTIAAGLNGPGRLRFGGLRDFILGAHFLTGDGRLIRGGGKVVKNAAGFDFPKMLVGSAGQLGVILEATFKVFPVPQERLTAATTTNPLPHALDLLARLARLPADLDALDLDPDGRLWIRLAGDHDTLTPRLQRLNQETGARFEPANDTIWADAGIGSHLSVKVPLTPARIPDLESALTPLALPRRYSVAGHLAWIGLPAGQEAALDAALRACSLSGLSLQAAPARLGIQPPGTAESLLRRAFDPSRRFA